MPRRNQPNSFTLEQHRKMYARCGEITNLRNPHLIAKLVDLADEWNRSYDSVRTALARQRVGRYSWSPAEWAYVRGEVNSVDEWREHIDEPIVEPVAVTAPTSCRLDTIEAKIDVLIDLVSNAHERLDSLTKAWS